MCCDKINGIRDDATIVISNVRFEIVFCLYYLSTTYLYFILNYPTHECSVGVWGSFVRIKVVINISIWGLLTLNQGKIGFLENFGEQNVKTIK